MLRKNESHVGSKEQRISCLVLFIYYVFIDEGDSCMISKFKLKANLMCHLLTTEPPKNCFFYCTFMGKDYDENSQT